MRQAHFAGFGYVAPSHQARIRYGVMGRSKLALHYQRVIIENAGHADYLEVSIASSKLSGGSTPETRRASIVLPDPGGPTRRMLPDIVIRFKSMACLFSRESVHHVVDVVLHRGL
jgi:hypothetical protein